MADNTAFQANFKLADGTLINIYAEDAAKFEAQLGSVQDLATLIHSVSDALGHAIPSAVKKQFPNAAIVHPIDDRANPPAGQAPTGTPSCKHGPMVFREGTSARGPWRAWMCSAPRGASDKCEANFLR